MKILVMGAGVIGVTTAYQLVKDGHQVTVVERLNYADRPNAVVSYACKSRGRSLKRRRKPG